MKTLVKNLFLRPQRTLDLEYQDGGDELQNLITEITEMRDPGFSYQWAGIKRPSTQSRFRGGFSQRKGKPYHFPSQEKQNWQVLFELFQ